MRRRWVATREKSCAGAAVRISSPMQSEMPLSVLITRPVEDGEMLAKMLRGHGMEPIVEPMMNIVSTEALPDLVGVQAVLLTSANGARALADKIAERDIPVFAVGNATAGTARELGFSTVESAAGDVAALADLVCDRLDPVVGALLHPAGSEVAGDLAGTLNEYGFMVRRVVLYEARLAVELSDSTCRLIGEGAIDAMLFFSPRTAQTFVILVNQAGLPSACAAIDAVCLSAVVADTVQELPWRSVRVAERPEMGALIAELDAWASQMNAGC
jgi:uroporphyrinogen-III synthase